MIFICKSSRQHNHHGRDRSWRNVMSDDGAMARASRNTFLSLRDRKMTLTRLILI
jgi:hypothetical protein